MELANKHQSEFLPVGHLSTGVINKHHYKKGNIQSKRNRDVLSDSAGSSDEATSSTSKYMHSHKQNKQVKFDTNTDEEINNLKDAMISMESKFSGLAEQVSKQFYTIMELISPEQGAQNSKNNQ